jgi:hypothetical protein
MYKCIIFMFSDLMSMTFSVEIFTVCIYVVLACVRLYICMYISMYLYAVDIEEHQWYFRMNLLCLLEMYIFVCMYVFIYVCICTWVYFIFFNSCYEVSFLREYFISCAYREMASYLQQRMGMWPRLRGYCRRSPTL